MTTTTKTADQLPAAQRRAYRHALELITRGNYYEIKDKRIASFDGCADVSVSVIVGIRNDEGTLAESICRSCYGFMIGARGGIYVYTDSYRRKYLSDFSMADARIW